MSLDLAIRYSAPKQRYTSGDVISGLVVMNVHTELRIERLEISCQCTSEAVINEGGTAHKANKQHYLKSQNCDFDKVFQIGVYEFPFSFTLPSSTELPETYSSGHVTLNSAREPRSGAGNIVWEIAASVPRFKIFDISLVASQQFWFVPRRLEPAYDAQREYSFSPQPVRKSSIFRKDRVPHVYVRCSVPESGIAQAPQPTGIELKMYSDVEGAVFVRDLGVFLEATTSFQAKGHLFSDISRTQILELNPNLPLSLDPVDLDMCMDSAAFSLPVVFYGSFDSVLIKLEYHLVVEAHISSFKDKRTKTHTVRLPVRVKPIGAPIPVHLAATTSDNFRDSGFEEFDFDEPTKRLNHSFSSSSLDELWEPEFEDEIAQLFRERRPYSDRSYSGASGASEVSASAANISGLSVGNLSDNLSGNLSTANTSVGANSLQSRRSMRSDKSTFNFPNQPYREREREQRERERERGYDARSFRSAHSTQSMQRSLRA